jgi:NADPH2:quinone reductase
MKAAFLERTGPPEVIRYADLPDPQPDPPQCLVRVAAVDMNPIDVYWRSGAVPVKLEFPFILGRSLAGTVLACGPNVNDFKPGDRVWATNLGFAGRRGSWAELAAVDAEWLQPSPEGVSDEAIAAISLVGVTAHLGLFRHAHLLAGETVLVSGGAGGVGSCVVQMAKAAGARVLALAGSDAKVAACRELGADAAVNYRTVDVPTAVKAFAPEGVNVWWETAREPDFERAVPLLAPRGRLVLMAGREARPPFPVGPFYVKDCSLLGFAMFNASAGEIRAAAGDINRWLATGTLRARIDRVLPLAQAAEAHRLQEASTVGRTGEVSGKIVLTPRAA